MWWGATKLSTDEVNYNLMCEGEKLIKSENIFFFPCDSLIII